ncbi:MAG: M48 family metallopeptidase [Candidatus Cloacimonetes bacterium]|jgi:predicted metal-dependent hydrolase|nr:M48 family metallopeptidase [Candidatus Cloacimonadota bacterium]MDY0172779.1 SprT family zinc-dependent metalloprotease [Candidatus Cloacimonadaceae bacterium]
MQQITVGDYTIDLVRKDIKNLHLSVSPPTGRIRLAVPRYLDEESIRRHIVSKLDWIKKHMAEFEQSERLPLLEYVSGESHYLAGKRYLLNVIPNSRINKIELRDDRYIDLYEKPGTQASHRQHMLQEWYRARLKVRIEPQILKWQKIIGVEINDWAVKQMKTRWGTCNIRAKRIWINLELAKRSEDCLEYIIVHELMHLLEKYHNEHFKELMDKFLPDWRERKLSLNKSLLSHEGESH